MTCGNEMFYCTLFVNKFVNKLLIRLKSIHMETVARQPYWNEEVCMSDTRGDSEESIAHRQQSM